MERRTYELINNLRNRGEQRSEDVKLRGLETSDGDLVVYQEGSDSPIAFVVKNGQVYPTNVSDIELRHPEIMKEF